MTRSRLGRAAALAAALSLTAAGVAYAATLQEGNLRIVVQSLIQPFKLPRTTPAPIAVFVSGHVGTANGETPPQLKRMTVRVNRHGLLQSRGLPVCQVPQIQPASTERALANCTEALIGSGQFWAHIILPGQAPYPTRGRLLVFNGKKNGKPAILSHIYTSNPFASSFVIAFTIKQIEGGTYGTELSASLPQALGDWGYVDRIKLTLRRKYRWHGREMSYFNAACPAPGAFKRTSFPLALVSFGFAQRKEVSVKVSKTCAVAHSRSRGLVFYRVLELAVVHEPVRYGELIANPGRAGRRAGRRSPVVVRRAGSSRPRGGRGELRISSD